MSDFSTFSVSLLAERGEGQEFVSAPGGVSAPRGGVCSGGGEAAPGGGLLPGGGVVIKRPRTKNSSVFLKIHCEMFNIFFDLTVKFCVSGNISGHRWSRR